MKNSMHADSRNCWTAYASTLIIAWRPSTPFRRASTTAGMRSDGYRKYKISDDLANFQLIGAQAAMHHGDIGADPGQGFNVAGTSAGGNFTDRYLSLLLTRWSRRT